jgi:hypothetical protein
MTPSTPLWLRLAIGLALASAAPAFAASAAPPPATTTHIANCVGGNDRVAFQPGHTGALLDTRDRERVTREMFSRYPMLERDGLVPEGIVLWHKPRGDWLFATLLPHPERPGAWCFAAHVVADGFDLMPQLMKKYFPAEAEAL